MAWLSTWITASGCEHVPEWEYRQGLAMFCYIYFYFSYTLQTVTLQRNKRAPSRSRRGSYGAKRARLALKSLDEIREPP